MVADCVRPIVVQDRLFPCRTFTRILWPIDAGNPSAASHTLLASILFFTIRRRPHAFAVLVVLRVQHRPPPSVYVPKTEQREIGYILATKLLNSTDWHAVRRKKKTPQR